MPGPLSVPTILPGEVQTRIIQDRIAYWAGLIEPTIKMVLPDDTWPGAVKLDADARRAKYVEITDPADIPYLADPNYLEKFSQNLVPVLSSPYWRGLMMFVPMFRAVRSDFLRLMG